MSLEPAELRLTMQAAYHAGSDSPQTGWLPNGSSEPIRMRRGSLEGYIFHNPTHVIVAFQGTEAEWGDIKTDLDYKRIVATKGDLLDQERRGEATKIQRIEKPEGRVILQGVEGGRGWSLNLSQETGNIVMTVAGDGSGFVVFGECTLP